MPKNYVILSFTEYRAPDALFRDRTNPTNTLVRAIGRRAERKGGSVAVHHLSDFFGALRVEREKKSGYQAIEHLLTDSSIGSLMIEAATHRSREWNTILEDVRTADKIIFAAHGAKDDTDFVLCEHNSSYHRCGDVKGIVIFLSTMLDVMKRDDPTITLNICYGARSSNHTLHHVKDPLSKKDIKSSLAFQIFAGLAGKYPNLRLTARTGAMSGSDTGTSLLSETEEAIIAAETLSKDYADYHQILQEVRRGVDEIEDLLDAHTSLSREEKQTVLRALDHWIETGGDFSSLMTILRDAHRRDLLQKAPYWMKAMAKLTGVLWIDLPSPFGGAKILRAAQRRIESRALFDQSQISEPKYGKFIYRQKNGQIVVSRWLGDQIVEVMSID